VIPKGAYDRSPAVETLSVDALWITDQSQPEKLIYGMLKALYNPANRQALQSARQGFHFIEAPLGPKLTPAPLHPGAARYFSEAGLLKAEQKETPARPVRKS
jgi:hypothetical protein